MFVAGSAQYDQSPTRNRGNPTRYRGVIRRCFHRPLRGRVPDTSARNHTATLVGDSYLTAPEQRVLVVENGRDRFATHESVVEERCVEGRVTVLAFFGQLIVLIPAFYLASC